MIDTLVKYFCECSSDNKIGEYISIFLNKEPHNVSFTYGIKVHPTFYRHLWERSERELFIFAGRVIEFN